MGTTEEKEAIIIDSREDDAEVAKRIIAAKELAEINNLLRDRDKLHNLVARMRGSHSDKEVYEVIKNKKKEILKMLAPTKKRGKGSVISRRFYQDASKAHNFFNVLNNGAVQLTSNVISQAQTQQADCPILTIGQVKSSGFHQYNWLQQGDSASAFWPLSIESEFPQSTQTQGWTGETGAHFYARSKSIHHCFNDLGCLGTAGVLQFTLPAACCDSIVYWGAPVDIQAINPWTIDAQYGEIWVDWVIYESPSGGGWPSSLWGSFEDVVAGGGIYVDDTTNAHILNEPKSGTWSFNREFRVKAGVEAKIYIGISLVLMEWDGAVSTMEHGIGDYFEIPYGITYIMTPA